MKAEIFNRAGTLIQIVDNVTCLDAPDIIHQSSTRLISDGKTVGYVPESSGCIVVLISEEK